MFVVAIIVLALVLFCFMLSSLRGAGELPQNALGCWKLDF